MNESTLTLRLEGITVSSRDEFLTVRVYAVFDGRAINCGMIVMFHHVFAAIALRPPSSELVQCEVTMTEGTVDEWLESVLGTTTTTTQHSY